MNDQLNNIEDRFKKAFPKSHLIISYERSVGKHSTSEQWVLYINFDELIEEDLAPTRIQEYFERFKDLENRLDFLMYRESCAVEGIKEEINQPA